MVIINNLQFIAIRITDDTVNCETHVILICNMQTTNGLSIIQSEYYGKW